MLSITVLWIVFFFFLFLCFFGFICDSDSSSDESLLISSLSCLLYDFAIFPRVSGHIRINIQSLSWLCVSFYGNELPSLWSISLAVLAELHFGSSLKSSMEWNSVWPWLSAVSLGGLFWENGTRIERIKQLIWTQTHNRLSNLW